MALTMNWCGGRNDDKEVRMKKEYIFHKDHLINTSQVPIWSESQTMWAKNVQMV